MMPNDSRGRDEKTVAGRAGPCARFCGDRSRERAGGGTCRRRPQARARAIDHLLSEIVDPPATCRAGVCCRSYTDEAQDRFTPRAPDQGENGGRQPRRRMLLQPWARRLATSRGAGRLRSGRQIAESSPPGWLETTSHRRSRSRGARQCVASIRMSRGMEAARASLHRPQTPEIGRNLVDLPLGESRVRHSAGMTHIAMRRTQER